MEDRRFILFVYDEYYPGGGVYDIRGMYASLDDASSKLKEVYHPSSYEHFQIYDILENKVYMDKILYGYINSGSDKDEMSKSLKNAELISLEI